MRRSCSGRAACRCIGVIVVLAIRRTKKSKHPPSWKKLKYPLAKQPQLLYLNDKLDHGITTYPSPRACSMTFLLQREWRTQPSRRT